MRGQNTFDLLVLPPGHREMVESLVTQHFLNKASSYDETDEVDIIRGKGTVLFLPLNLKMAHSCNRQRFDPTSPRSSRSREDNHGRLVHSDLMTYTLGLAAHGRDRMRCYIFPQASVSNNMW